VGKETGNGELASVRVRGVEEDGGEIEVLRGRIEIRGEMG